MLKEKYDKWAREFMESWKDLDYKKTLDLLSKDVKYYENPIDMPCSSFEKVIELWKIVGDNQKDIEYRFEILSYTEDICIINWQMSRTLLPSNIKQEIDGIFEISLDENGLCKYFKQWRYSKEK